MAGQIHEVRVGTEPDVRGQGVFADAKKIAPGLDKVKTTTVYRVEGVDPAQIPTLANRLFAEPLDGQTFTVDSPFIEGASHTVEVGYKLGVMDPVAGSILKSAGDLDIPIAAATASMEYGFYGDVSGEEASKIAAGLFNKTVEQVIENPPATLLIEGNSPPMPEVSILNAGIDELMAISKDKLFLDQSEMQTIQDYFRDLGREPTWLELEIIAGRLSEHCGHKTFRAKVIVDGVEKPPLFTRITETARLYFGDSVVTAFEDNAGGIRFYEDEVIVGKVETHNSPSAIEPFGGAMTGTGGVLRDIAGTGQGARNLLSTDMFCFAPPDLDPANLPSGTLPPDYLLEHVVRGVGKYGNNMGVPTSNGSVHFHPDFRAKPSVIVGAYGILPEKYSQKGKPEVGDLVVTVGGRTGRDGIHGATFSSGEMTDRTINVSSSAVQIGNPIEEKRMFDALLEARDADIIRAITDCGAAGFSSAVGEMGEETGVTADVSKVPLKYSGLSAWEIWMSESQERMSTAIAPENIDAFMAICAKHGVEASVFGQFDGSKRMRVTDGDKIIADLDYEFLKHGFPQRVMEAHFEKLHYDESIPEMPTDWNATLKAVMSHGNVASMQKIVDRYDHTVQGTNALQPFSGVNSDGPNDAVVLTPILGKPYGMVVAHGMNPALNRIDPYYGSLWAGAEAMANYVAVGGNPETAALVNNYIAPFPDTDTMGSLDLQVDGVVDLMHALKRPVISGKDSLSSTYRGKDGQVIKIPPVLAISVFGGIPDAEKTVTSDIKREGSYLYLVGKQDSGMGGSIYYDVNNLVGNEVPKVDLEVLPVTLRAVHHAILTGEVLSCHDVSEGGVIGAVSEMAFGGDCGVELDIDPMERPDMFLFNETAGTFVVELDDPELAEIMFGHLPHMRLGTTTKDKQIKARAGDKDLFSISTDVLKQAWKEPMGRVFN